MKSFNVDLQNTKYTSRNGVLFTNDLSTLIAYPALKEDISFTCPNQTSKINAYAFADAIYLQVVDLENASNDLSEIGAYTFANCTSLKRIIFADSSDYSIKKIGFKAFKDCTSLEEFNGYHSVTEIGESAFYGCTKLTTITLYNAPLTKIGSEAFSNCGSVTSLSLPGTLESIGRSAFSGFANMEEITISYGSTRTMLDQLMARSTGCGLEDYYDKITTA